MAASRVLLVEARYYTHINDELLRGAAAELERHGIAHERVAVPGAFEIPAAIQFAHLSRAGFDGYVALGCVIRGETSHYDLICTECARGLQDLALRERLAIGFGVLTVENEAQALARARIDKKNKGGEAVRACLAMIELKRRYALGTP
ncbi:MAG TPA: 6,7-dimethyl-8-ribityllumazine synthase [Stellaceae bacterium]|jgi:6,7-dimethyl-8-ribityllumazine synthase|nr:6,7-dimethyl-8-ribityllumazine synthase [Stellaceae bacterium]